MDEKQYIYRNRAVAFLDVLGFRQKLFDFEQEAKNNRISSNVTANEETLYQRPYISNKANDFINTFKSAISKLDVEKYRYYLFSDNICITSIKDTSKSDLQDLLLVSPNCILNLHKRGIF